MTLVLASVKSTAMTYSFRTAAERGWALCTMNDSTGELLITSGYGAWSHRWDTRSLGSATLTAFIGGADVDYLARKLQNGSGGEKQWSATLTAQALRRELCGRRLNDGRAQLEGRLEPEDYAAGAPLPHLGGPCTTDGLPLCRSNRISYMTRAQARLLWRTIGTVADECDGSKTGDLFIHRLLDLDLDDNFADYVTSEPSEYIRYEPTAEDIALRETVLPALISACRDHAHADAVVQSVKG